MTPDDRRWQRDAERKRFERSIEREVRAERMAKQDRELRIGMAIEALKRAAERDPFNRRTA